MRVVWAGLLALVVQGFSVNAGAGGCGGNFADWIEGVRAEAVALGVSEAAAGALNRGRPSPRVLALDRSQKVLAQDWQTFAGRMVNAYRLKLGAGHLRDFAEVYALATLARDRRRPGLLAADARLQHRLTGLSRDVGGGDGLLAGGPGRWCSHA